MLREYTIRIDEDLQKKFEMALQLSGEDKNVVVDALLRSYVSKAFAQAAAAYDQPRVQQTRPNENVADVNYGKANFRIPKWARKPFQINHKIIRAYLQLAEEGDVTYEALLAHCTDKDAHPDVYVPTFASNFAQMKFDGPQSHGKVFEVNEVGVVSIWSIVEDTLMQYKNDFLYHSVDAFYLNKNNQRNLGRTVLQGTDHLQYLYKMKCEDCGFEYHANGSDIFQKKCPSCQGGTNTGE